MLRRSSKVSLRGDSARDSFSSYLLKRSGGHEGHTTLRKKFQERFFVLQGTNLLYFRSQDEYLAGGASLGSLGVEGSHLTVEEENAGADSCTFCIHTPQRQLLLVARPAALFHEGWKAVLEEAAFAGDAATSAPAPPPPLRATDDAVRSRTGSNASAGSSADDEARPARPSRAVTEGYLAKRAGGWANHHTPREHWQVRYFVLPTGQTVLRYYRTADDATAGRSPLGEQDVVGAHVARTDVGGGGFTFAVMTPGRELRLRADSAADLQLWMGALVYAVGALRSSDEGGTVSRRGSTSQSPAAAASTSPTAPAAPAARAAQNLRRGSLALLQSLKPGGGGGADVAQALHSAKIADEPRRASREAEAAAVAAAAAGLQHQSARDDGELTEEEAAGLLRQRKASVFSAALLEAEALERDGQLKEAAEIIAEALVRKKREDDIALSVQLQAERRAAAAATREAAGASSTIDSRLRAPELRERAL